MERVSRAEGTVFPLPEGWSPVGPGLFRRRDGWAVYEQGTQRCFAMPPPEVRGPRLVDLCASGPGEVLMMRINGSYSLGQGTDRAVPWEFVERSM